MNQKPCKYGHADGRYENSYGCITCARERAKARYAKSPEGIKARIHRWQIDNRARCLKTRREWKRVQQGLPKPTRPEAENCEICGDPPGKKSMHLDPCHETGKFRGWLCFKCNTGLGQFRDKVEFLTAAISYLSKPLDSV